MTVLEMEAGSDTLVRFGGFELDLRSRELSRGTDRVRLQDQPFEILRILLERRGTVVTREELRARLWPAGTFVDFEHSLNAAVKRLRHALGDDAANPRYVETLPRRGYRFVGDLQATPGQKVDGLRRVRLAVLPFADLGNHRGKDFSQGLTEEIIWQLDRLSGGQIGVIFHSSSVALTAWPVHESGRSFRSDYRLEGSARRVRPRVRISARLVRASDNTNIWVQTYERPLADPLSVQHDVATRIARAVTAEVLPNDANRTSLSNARA